MVNVGVCTYGHQDVMRVVEVDGLNTIQRQQTRYECIGAEIKVSAPVNISKSQTSDGQTCNGSL